MTNTLMLAAAFGLLSAAPAFAQSAQSDTTNAFDSRWNPYLGCWRVLDEQVDAQTVPVAKGLTVCVRPSGPSGVAITTTVDGKNVLEQTIVADGSAHPLSEENCQGTQTSQWSRDGERLFTRVELTCAGRPKRTVSGITQVTGGRWVEAQATLIDNEQHDVRLRRFQRTGDQPTGVSTLARAPMNVEDVIEASGKALSPAVEAALVESGGRFTLNSRTLKQLADAGVSPQVIDVMVAQAYPERFQIERPQAYQPLANVGSGGTTYGSNTTVVLGSAAYPYPFYDPFFNSYYYYSPFAYPYYWGASYLPYRYGRYYGYAPYYNNYNIYPYPGSIYGSGGYGSGGYGSGGNALPGSPDSPGGDGVAVKGRGYTRVRPAGSGENSGSSTPAQRSSPSSRGVRSASGGSDSSGSSSGSSSSGGSSSGGSSSGGGRSSGGSSGGSGGGRTAQPR
jgi:hypothetical protein